MRAIERPSITAVFDHYGIRILREGGGWTKCECPSLEHEDMNPSASVNEDLGKWNCFSCGRTGDGLDIIMERESCAGIADALRFAEKHFGSSGGDVRSGRSSGGRVPGGKGNHRGGGTFRPPWRGL